MIPAKLTNFSNCLEMYTKEGTKNDLKYLQKLTRIMDIIKMKLYIFLYMYIYYSWFIYIFFVRFVVFFMEVRFIGSRMALSVLEFLASLLLE